MIPWHQHTETVCMKERQTSAHGFRKIHTWFTGKSDILAMVTVMTPNWQTRTVQQVAFITQALNVIQPDDA